MWLVTSMCPIGVIIQKRGKSKDKIKKNHMIR